MSSAKMTYGTKKTQRQLAFELQNSRVLESAVILVTDKES